MSELIQEEIYLGDYADLAALEADIDWYWSGSRLSRYLNCFRSGSLVYDKNLALIGDQAHPLTMGGGLHAAFAHYYAWGGPAYGNQTELLKQTLKIFRHEVEQRGGLFPLPQDHKHHHLTVGHGEIVIRNYFDWAKIHDSVVPVILQKDEIDWTNVLGAKLRLLPDGRVVLGESAFIMQLEVDTPWEGPVQFTYSGIPDLPVTMPTGIYVMDHKATGMGLGPWFFSQYRFDNALRIYCVMIKQLMHKKVEGILINGIAIGKSATSIKSKATKFLRYGPIDYYPGHFEEALLNQAALIRTREFMRDTLDYFPQATGQYCRNCPMKGLCATSPEMRAATEMVDYTQREKMPLLKLSEGLEL